MNDKTSTPRTVALGEDSVADTCGFTSGEWDALSDQARDAIYGAFADRAELRAALVDLLKRFPRSDFGDDPRWADVARGYAVVDAVRP